MNLGTVKADGSILLSNENIKFREAMTGDFERVRQTSTQKLFLSQNGLHFVTSSFISGIGVKGDDLIIRFHNSSMYQYTGFASHYDSIFAADSKGQYFNKHIRPTKKYKKITSLPFPSGEEITKQVAKMNDKAMFEAMGLQDIKNIAKAFVGEDLHVKEVLINGVVFNKFIIGNLELLRPILSQ